MKSTLNEVAPKEKERKYPCLGACQGVVVLFSSKGEGTVVYRSPLCSLDSFYEIGFHQRFWLESNFTNERIDSVVLFNSD